MSLVKCLWQAGGNAALGLTITRDVHLADRPCFLGEIDDAPGVVDF